VGDSFKKRRINMDWVQTITIIASVIGVMIYFLQRIERDISQLGDRIDKQGIRLDGHATRIDQLYKIIIEILKERIKL
jgi:hypothetical protein